MTTKYADKGGVFFQNDPCDLKLPANSSRFGFNVTANCTCNSYVFNNNILVVIWLVIIIEQQHLYLR